MQTARNRPTRGFSIVEVTIAVTLFAVVVLGIVMVTARDDKSAKASLAIGVAETRAQQMLSRIQDELAHARGASPRAVLTQTLSSGETGGLTVDSTLGFPSSGTLLIDRGSGALERLAYAQLDASLTRFLGLARGEQCTQPTTHAQNADVLWCGLAEPILLQSNPAASLFDGRALESTGPVYFRGDGTGFSYRVPVDPTGGNDFLTGGDVRWGAEVAGTPTQSGWAAIWFQPSTSYEEPLTGFDLNHDGDTADVFDVGQLRKRTWDTSAPAVAPSEVALGPTVIVQERCRHGRDLDGDGFDDPMFLWDASSRRLHVRLFVIGTSGGNAPILREVETTIFLRNDPEG